MEKRYTIGQLAAAAGVPASTIRYYERAGLFRPSGRSAGNYRLYDEGALERLRFIRAAQATGFALEDVAGLLAHRHSSPSACRKVQALIAERLERLEEQLEDLRRVRNVLEATLRSCRREEQSGHCAALDGLDRASGPPPRVSPRARRKKS